MSESDLDLMALDASIAGTAPMPDPFEFLRRTVNELDLIDRMTPCTAPAIIRFLMEYYGIDRR